MAKKKPKEEPKISFDELVENATRHIHSSLLKDGASGMRGAIHLHLRAAIQWSKEK